jgi:hypothetical protein
MKKTAYEDFLEKEAFLGAALRIGAQLLDAPGLASLAGKGISAVAGKLGPAGAGVARAGAGIQHFAEKGEAMADKVLNLGPSMHPGFNIKNPMLAHVAQTVGLDANHANRLTIPRAGYVAGQTLMAKDLGQALTGSGQHNPQPPGAPTPNQIPGAPRYN